MLEYLLILTGLIAGFVDAIAGGGGLITVPVLSLALGPGAIAIGTNKIVAATAAGVALFVYRRAGHVTLKGNWAFALLVGLGAMGGASCSRFVSPDAYKWLLVIMAPIVLWIVFHREMWVKQAIRENAPAPNMRLLWLAGIGCGFYDGLAGPGGGTLMFLSLFVFARLPLLTSMATAKIANLMSASLALATFAFNGQVIWHLGGITAAGMAFGAFIGAQMAMRNAAVVARFALLIVSSLLILRLLLS